MKSDNEKVVWSFFSIFIVTYILCLTFMVLLSLKKRTKTQTFIRNRRNSLDASSILQEVVLNELHNNSSNTNDNDNGLLSQIEAQVEKEEDSDENSNEVWNPMISGHTEMNTFAPNDYDEIVNRNYDQSCPFFSRCPQLDVSRSVEGNRQIFPKTKAFDKQNLEEVIRKLKQSNYFGNQDGFWLSFSNINMREQAAYGGIAYGLKEFLDEGDLLIQSSVSCELGIGLDFHNCNFPAEGAVALLSTINNSLHNSFHRILALDISVNSSMDSSFTPYFVELLSKEKTRLSLVELSLNNNIFSDGNLSVISSFLRSDNKLRKLDLSNCGIERNGALLLAQALGKVNVGNELSPTSPSSAVSVDSLLFNDSLDSSSPRRSRYTKRDFDAESRDTVGSPMEANPIAAKYNQSLLVLLLSNNSISAAGGKYLAQALCWNSTLKELDISYQLKSKKVGSEGAREFAFALRGESVKSRCQLEVLRMARNNIGFEGCRHLASALSVNTTLTELDIGNINYISVAGARQLGEALVNCTTSRLQWLTVGDYRFPISVISGDKWMYYNGYSAQEESITSSSSIQSSTGIVNNLSLAWNHMAQSFGHLTHSDAFVDTEQPLSLPNVSHSTPISLFPSKLSIKVARKSKKMEQVGNNRDISEHGMNDEFAVVVGNLLKNNRSLLYLQLSSCVLPIQKLIGTHRHRSLDLSNSELTSMDAIVIGILVAENPHIRSLNLSNNNFSSTEGENFIATALDQNKTLKLDSSAWSLGQMYADGYQILASLQGLSASGARIEPQRLDGWFYQSLTGISAVIFYINMFSDIMVIKSFVNNPQTYHRSWTFFVIFFFCLPTVIYGYNTFRTMYQISLETAITETLVVLFQLTSMFQAYECIVASMESSAMLDYKFVFAVFKSLPQTFLQTYILFTVAIFSGEFEFWVIVALLTSIITITVVFIIQYDRKDSRKLAMQTISEQPYCTILVAHLLTFFGMGTDTAHVQEFINYDSYYTSHYVWAYIYQVAGLFARVCSVAWVAAVIPSPLQLILLFVIIWMRYMILILLDERAIGKGPVSWIISSLALSISDSAWFIDEHDDEYSMMMTTSLVVLSSMENFMGILYARSVSLSIVQHKMAVIGINAIFWLVMAMLIIRWTVHIIWAVHIHYPSLFYQRKLKKSWTSIVLELFKDFRKRYFPSH